MCGKSNESESGGALTRRQLAVLLEHLDTNHRALTEAVADVPRKIAESEQRLREEIRAVDKRLGDVHTSLSGQISAVARRIGALEPRVDALELKIAPRI